MFRLLGYNFGVKGRFRAFAVHLLLTSMIVTVVLAFAYAVWFPAPFRQLVGGTALIGTAAIVVLISGPVLTLVVFKPLKSARELTWDLSVVLAIQGLAFSYSLNIIAWARPVAVVYEVDRFRVVTFSDIDISDFSLLPDWAQPWRISGPHILGVRQAKNIDEKLTSIENSLRGLEPSQRPDWWQDYELSIANVLRYARPLKELQDIHNNKKYLIYEAVNRAIVNRKIGETGDGTALRWLPLVSRRESNWVVLLDPHTARFRGYVNLDGFLQ